MSVDPLASPNHGKHTHAGVHVPNPVSRHRDALDDVVSVAPPAPAPARVMHHDMAPAVVVLRHANEREIYSETAAMRCNATLVFLRLGSRWSPGKRV